MTKVHKHKKSQTLRRSLFISFLAYLTITILPIAACADTFPRPEPTDDLIGGLKSVRATAEDTLIDIALRYNQGYEELKHANPNVDPWLPRKGTVVILPSFYLLPNAPREGIVVNIAEMRMYYFPKTKKGEAGTLQTYPLSIGRGDWNTPSVVTKIARKQKNPTWYPPESVRKEHAKQGDILPKAVPAGSKNPLGGYALYLSLPSYLIHGSNKEFGIGMQVTHGCIRMSSNDIEWLFNNVPVGTQVRIVNQPFKVGWDNGVLYAEVHPWLDGTSKADIKKQTTLKDLLIAARQLHPDYPIDWNAVATIQKTANGIPAAVGPTLTPMSFNTSDDDLK